MRDNLPSTSFTSWDFTIWSGNKKNYNLLQKWIVILDSINHYVPKSVEARATEKAESITMSDIDAREDEVLCAIISAYPAWVRFRPSSGWNFCLPYSCRHLGHNCTTSCIYFFSLGLRKGCWSHIENFVPAPVLKVALLTAVSTLKSITTSTKSTLSTAPSTAVPWSSTHGWKLRLVGRLIKCDLRMT